MVTVAFSSSLVLTTNVAAGFHGFRLRRRARPNSRTMPALNLPSNGSSTRCFQEVPQGSKKQASEAGINEAPHITNNAGNPIWEYSQTETVGARGPATLEDAQLLEKIAQFDRERIPERVVHARGITAKGFFEVTHDISHLTAASVFSGVGKKTPVLTRFSTVIHPRGSSETMRDPRGFSVKFYTEQGNWDLVGNNIPVFFIRDGIDFPDVIHALKPSPITNVQEPWRIADYFSFKPESMHMFTWVFDDWGIPANYRVMDGFGVHTFIMANKEGEQTYVKFHWRTRQEGQKFLITTDEAIQVGGSNPSHATVDLIEAIRREDYPSWDLYIQIMDPKTEMEYDFDPLDDTKVWPEDQFPLHPVGRMTLDTNIDNFHNEAEQAAFSPANMPPGILPSNDKMLQSRLFSYADTQRHRLGPNYLQLPVNRPRCPFQAPTTQEGLMNTMPMYGREINYHPSHFDGPPVAEEDVTNAKITTSDEPVSGQRVRQAIPKANDFGQAGDRFRSFDPERQERFIQRMAGVVGHPRATQEIRDKWVNYFNQMDNGLGDKLQKAMESMKAEDLKLPEENL